MHVGGRMGTERSQVTPPSPGGGCWCRSPPMSRTLYSPPPSGNKAVDNPRIRCFSGKNFRNFRACRKNFPEVFRSQSINETAQRHFLDDVCKAGGSP